HLVFPLEEGKCSGKRPGRGADQPRNANRFVPPVDAPILRAPWMTPQRHHSERSLIFRLEAALFRVCERLHEYLWNDLVEPEIDITDVARRVERHTAASIDGACIDLHRIHRVHADADVGLTVDDSPVGAGVAAIARQVTRVRVEDADLNGGASLGLY